MEALHIALLHIKLTVHRSSLIKFLLKSTKIAKWNADYYYYSVKLENWNVLVDLKLNSVICLNFSKLFEIHNVVEHQLYNKIISKFSTFFFLSVVTSMGLIEKCHIHFLDLTTPNHWIEAVQFMFYVTFNEANSAKFSYIYNPSHTEYPISWNMTGVWSVIIYLGKMKTKDKSNSKKEIIIIRFIMKLQTNYG